MYTKLATIAMLGFAALPTALGATCEVKGTSSSNSAGFGSGGTTNTASGSLVLLKDGEQVWSDTESSQCQTMEHRVDDAGVWFTWIPQCGPMLNKCKVSNNNQETEEVDASKHNKFYGLGIYVWNECNVQFEC